MNKLSRIFRPFHIPPKKKIKIFKEKDTLSKGYKVCILRYFVLNFMKIYKIKCYV